MRGFSYLWVLLLTLALATIIAGVATVTGRDLQRIGLDRELLQAKAYAESGITYYKNTHPALPCTLPLTYGRFEITAKQGIIYSTGYCRRATYKIRLKGNTLEPCFD